MPIRGDSKNMANQQSATKSNQVFVSEELGLSLSLDPQNGSDRLFLGGKRNPRERHIYGIPLPGTDGWLDKQQITICLCLNYRYNEFICV